jgi:hypothetical protein
MAGTPPVGSEFTKNLWRGVGPLQRLVEGVAAPPRSLCRVNHVLKTFVVERVKADEVEKG